MAKRRHHKRRSGNDGYYDREQMLNRKIRTFKNNFYNLHNPPIASEYDEMNELRLNIKYLFRCQEHHVWQKSFNRKHAYFSQLSLFKSIYMKWKRLTAFIYLEEYHNVPHHIAMWAKSVGSTRVPTKVFGT
jgi:hypothetical protein